MFDPSKAEHVYIAIGYTNLRMGIDGLVKTIQETFHENPQTKSLFLFCGRKKDRIKGLYWDNNGYLLLYKRLENGRYKWPRTESELKELTEQQFRWLLEGLSIYQKDAFKKIEQELLF